MTTKTGDCNSVRELIAAYSVGATDPEETALVEAGLADCPEVVAELAEYLALADEMLFLAPASPKPLSRADGLQMPDLTLLRRDSAPMPQAQPVARSNRRWLGAAGIAAAVLVLVALNLMWFIQINELRTNQQQLNSELQDQSELLLAVSSGQAEHIQMTVTPDGRLGSNAIVLWSPQQQVGSVFVFGFPSLSPDKTYQFWGVRDNNAFSLGTFRVDAQGNGELVFHSQESLDSFDALGISTEPIQGSSQPTSPHLVISGA